MVDLRTATTKVNSTIQANPNLPCTSNRRSRCTKDSNKRACKPTKPHFSSRCTRNSSNLIFLAILGIQSWQVNHLCLISNSMCLTQRKEEWYQCCHSNFTTKVIILAGLEVHHLQHIKHKLHPSTCSRIMEVPRAGPSL